MAGPVTNRFEETDGMNFFQETSSLPVLYFRDGDGLGELSIDLNNCTETPAGDRWEIMSGASSAPCGRHRTARVSCSLSEGNREFRG